MKFPALLQIGMGMLWLSTFAQAFASSPWGPSRLLKETRTSSEFHMTSKLEESVVVENVSANGEEEEKTCYKTADILSLDSIRSTLIRQEETIIFALIERAQFRNNARVYEKGGFGDLGLPLGSTPLEEGEEEEEMSFLEYMLVGTEALHCGVRRYTSPEEHAFFPDRLPGGIMEALPQLDYPNLLSSEGEASQVNFNPILLAKYCHVIVPSLCSSGDDEQHGSTVLCDIAALQALSRRVHYGKFVAESKYRGNPEEYQRLVDAGDAEGVMALLTNEAVEKQVLQRARLKAATYGREPLLTSLPDIEEGPDDSRAILAAAAASAVVAAVESLSSNSKRTQGKVDAAVIESVYRDIIIPLTKDIEVAYLFKRCGREPPPEYAPDRMSIDCK